MIVYVVTATYCDNETSIIGVSLDEEAANKIATLEKANGPDSVGVEEWDTEQYAQILKDGLKPYHVRFTEDGTKVESASLIGCVDKHLVAFRSGNVMIDVWAINAEEALKKATPIAKEYFVNQL